MQHDEPAEPGRRANRLPTPGGGFPPIRLMYEPEATEFDGPYELSPIRRAFDSNPQRWRATRVARSNAGHLAAHR